jgi:hypothetical protein
MKALVFAAMAALAVSPAFAGMGGTHVHTVHQNTPVDNVTHERTVVRIHPTTEIDDITTVLHHQQIVRSTEHVGPAPAQGHENTVTHYIDRYPVIHETRNHQVDGSPAIMHEITRIVNRNVYRHHTDYQRVTEQEAPRVIVHRRRKDIDP